MEDAYHVCLTKVSTLRLSSIARAAPCNSGLWGTNARASPEQQNPASEESLQGEQEEWGGFIHHLGHQCLTRMDAKCWHDAPASQGRVSDNLWRGAGKSAFIT